MSVGFRPRTLKGSFGNRRLKRIIRTVREDRHNSIAHVFDNKPLEGSDDRTDLFIIAIYKIKPQLFNDKEDFENAARGFIGKPDTLTIKNAQGRPVWDLQS